MSIQTIRTVFEYLGILAFVCGGFLLVVGNALSLKRAHAGRIILLGLLFVIVAHLVTKRWLP